MSSSTCVFCWTAYILHDDTRSLQYQTHSDVFHCFHKRNFGYWAMAKTTVGLLSVKLHNPNILLYRKIQTHAGVHKTVVQGIRRLVCTVTPIICDSCEGSKILGPLPPPPMIYGGLALIFGRLKFKPRLSYGPEMFTRYFAVRLNQGWRIFEAACPNCL